MTMTLSPEAHTIRDWCPGCSAYSRQTAGPGDGALTFPTLCTVCGSCDDGRRPR